MGSFPSFFSYFCYISKAVCIKQSDSRSALIRLSLGSHWICLSLCHKAKHSQLSNNLILFLSRGSPRLRVTYEWPWVQSVFAWCHWCLCINRSSFSSPAHHRGEPALSGPSQLKKCGSTAWCNPSNGEESRQHGLALPGAGLPGRVTVTGPQKSALGMVFSAWLCFHLCWKPGRARGKTSLMAVGGLLPAGSEAWGNSAAQRWAIETKTGLFGFSQQIPRKRTWV